MGNIRRTCTETYVKEMYVKDLILACLFEHTKIFSWIITLDQNNITVLNINIHNSVSSLVLWESLHLQPEISIWNFKIKCKFQKVIRYDIFKPVNLHFSRTTASPETLLDQDLTALSLTTNSLALRFNRRSEERPFGIRTNILVRVEQSALVNIRRHWHCCLRTVH